MAGIDFDQCQSCHRPIRWVTTEAGKPMPIDPDPTAEGNIVPRVNADGSKVAHVLTGDELDDRTTSEPRFVSHFATCPHAHHHRRRS